MNHSLKDTHQKLKKQTLELLWQQWSTIGVAGTAESDLPYLIDPEALLLFSTEFARHDSRLFDEVLDWLHRNGNTINLKRLFSIRKQYTLGNPDVLLAMARKLRSRSSTIKWRSVSKKSIHHSSDGKVIARLDSLFPQLPFNIEVLKSADIEFHEKGYYRPNFEARGMSQSPAPNQPSNLIFKLRAFFGCNSRAEIMAWLLTHQAGHPAKIARDIHYFNKSVQATLNEMESSGLVYSRRTKREKHFHINPDDWHAFIQPQQQSSPPSWINWAETFTSLEIIFKTLDNAETQNSSELLVASQLKTAFEQANLALDFTTSQHQTGTDYLHTLLKDFERLLPGLQLKEFTY